MSVKIAVMIKWKLFVRRLNIIMEGIRMPRVPEWLKFAVSMILGVSVVISVFYMGIFHEYDVKMTKKMQNIAYNTAMYNYYDYGRTYVKKDIKELSIDGVRTGIFSSDVDILVMWSDQGQYRYQKFSLDKELNK